MAKFLDRGKYGPTAKFRANRLLKFESLESRQLLALTHWYTFNTGTGEDLAGDADINLVNGATIQADQVVLANSGVTSGQSATVQYLSLPTTALPTSGPLTIVTWFTTTNSADWTRVFDIGNQTGSNGDSYLFFSPQSGFNDSRLVLSPGGGAGNERIASTSASDNGLERMVAAVVDSATDTLRLYLDGAEVATAPLNGADIGSITKSVAYFGRSLYNADPGFTGSINEIRIYDEALSASAIAAQATAGPTLDEPDQLPDRQMEDLNRGVIALRRATNQVYVGWRMLGTDPTSVAFNLYRSTSGGRAVKLNTTPLTQTTDFVDSSANLTMVNTYYVRPVIAGIELAPSESFTLAANSPVNQFLNVPLQIPAGGTTPSGEAYTYNANDASVGDVDGDGQYEIILKWDPSNSKDNSQSGYTGNVYVDAYKLDGTLLWRIDLGRNIRAGAHYTQFMVYDLDGDGRAEVAMKTAPGTIDGQGNAVLLGSDSSSADYRNSSGYILTGPEYLTVFNGETGAALATVPFEPARGTASQWGDDYGNRVDRFLGGIAYFDGVRPSLVMARGYYGPRSSSGQARNEIAAYDFRDGELTLRWHFKAGYNINGNINSEYIGQGTHSLSIADVDGDGFDEVIYGAAAIDHDGTGLYSTGLGHGDALHVSDMDPTRPGLEVFQVHEGTGGNGHIGASYRDAATGEILFAGTVVQNSEGDWPDVGRGVAADIDPNHLGYEFWGSANFNGENRGIYNVTGERLYDAGNVFSNFVVWWDADLSRELLDGTTIANWNNPGRSNFDLDPGTSGTQQYAPNGSSNNGTKSTPALSADILGDWREEVVWRRSDNTALMIFSTIIPATNRLTTLMHDSQYRVAIAWQNTAYNQPPHPSFYLGAGMTVPPQPNIYLASANPAIPGDFDLDEDVDHDDLAIWQQTRGTSQPQGYLPGDADGDGYVGGRDFLIWQRNYGQSQTSLSSTLQTVAITDFQASEAQDSQDTAIHDAVFANLAASLATTLAVSDLELLDQSELHEESGLINSPVLLGGISDPNCLPGPVAASSTTISSIAASNNETLTTADPVDDEFSSMWEVWEIL